MRGMASLAGRGTGRPRTFDAPTAIEVARAVRDMRPGETVDDIARRFEKLIKKKVSAITVYRAYHQNAHLLDDEGVA